jgi:hypothetical protein
MTTKLSCDTINEQVSTFLKAHLEPESGLVEAITTQEEMNEEGNDVVIINITFAPSEQPLDPDQLADIPFRLGQQLEAAGEQRFCHVRIHFAERQALRGW